MRFVIVSLLCLPLLLTGCLSDELKKAQERNYTQADDNLDSIGGDTRMKADSQTVGSRENPQQAPQSMNRREAKDPKNYGWNDEALQHLAVFQSLLSADAEAARTEITKIAKIRFGAHPLADEWSKLFFRLYRDRKGHALDMRRYWELEMQLLSDVDAKTYVEGIQDYQLGLKQINVIIKMIRSQGDDPTTIKVDFDFNYSSYLKGE